MSTLPFEVYRHRCDERHNWL